MATKANWLKTATDELNRLQKSIDFVSALSATKPKSIVLLTLDYHPDSKFLIEPIAFNHLSIRCTILASTDIDWKWSMGTFNYNAINFWATIPETDLPLYIGWPYTGTALSNYLRK